MATTAKGKSRVGELATREELEEAIRQVTAVHRDLVEEVEKVNTTIDAVQRNATARANMLTGVLGDERVARTKEHLRLLTSVDHLQLRVAHLEKPWPQRFREWVGRRWAQLRTRAPWRDGGP